MTTDLEADLRREFNSVGAPSGLAFNSESVLRQGNRTIRRHRLIAAGSAAMAVGLVAMGATVMTRPDDKAALQPAHRTATSGIVRAQVVFPSGTFQVDLNRDPSVESNVHYSVITRDGKRHEVGGSSSNPKPGLKTVQKPDATWGSGMVNGHPVTIGLVPSPARNLIATFADGGSYGIGSEELKGTGYWMFAVDYRGANKKEATQPVEIASLRWSGATGIVDGIGNGQRLTGRVLPINTSLSVEVVLQPSSDGQTVVFGRLVVPEGTLPSEDGPPSSAYDLNAAITDSSGAAVVTGRLTITRKTTDLTWTMNDGPPIAAGILPPGSSNIGVELTTGDTATVRAAQQRLPDGRVIFAMSAGFAHPTDPGKDSIKAITWTNADGTQGRIPVA